jgi:hypothetical protein
LKTVQTGAVEGVTKNSNKGLRDKAITRPALIYPVPDMSALERTSNHVIDIDFSAKVASMPHRPSETRA